MITIVRNYSSVNSPISHKYLNHGINVPTLKCSNNSRNHSPNLYKFSVTNFLKVRTYSTSSSSNDNNEFNHDKFIPSLTQVIYEDAFAMVKAILKDNAGKAGIYMFTNKITADTYEGQSIDLRKRFLNCFNLNYINKSNELVINRALIKYGYSNFSLTILEYCDKSDLDTREQYYFDILNPKYNIQKIAGGSSRGLILSEETKDKISKALKGVYFFPVLSNFRINRITKQTYFSGRSPDANGIPNTFRSRVLAENLGKNPRFYEDSCNLKKLILIENKGKSGIYMWTNKITGDIYIGQSVDLANRLKVYFNPNYLEKNKSFLISRALMKYGHSSFSLTIFQYCGKSELNEREQYYLDNLEPDYNIPLAKIASSFLGYTPTEEAKAKISKALKGINRSEETKELIRKKALDRKHSEDTKLKMSMSSPRGNPVNVYEKWDSSGFKLIGSFVSARRAAIFLGLSKSTVIKYTHSGAIYKDRYKFSSK